MGPAHPRGHALWSGLVVVAGLVALGMSPSAAAVTDYYVDRTIPQCSDTGPGTATEPFCTLTSGVSRLVAGSTLYVGNGTYPETIKPAVSGTASAPITVTAWPGRSPVVGTGVTNGAYVSGRSHITLDGLTFDGTVAEAVYVTKSSNIVISDNLVTGAGRQVSGETAGGISVRASADSVVTGNRVRRTTEAGIYVTARSTRVTVSHNESSGNAAVVARLGVGIYVNGPGNSVIGNVTHDNEDSGIQVTSGGDNTLLALNVTYNNGDHGIDNLNAKGGRVVGNTVYRNCTSGINVEGTSGNYLVANNVAVDNAVYPTYNGISCSRRAGNIGIWDSAPGTTTVDHNLVWLSRPGVMYAFAGQLHSSLQSMQAATGQEAHGVQGDPRFLDPTGWDLRIGAGSPAIDRGDSGASGEQETDILGLPRVDDPATPDTWASGPRSYDDLGAHEFQPSPPPPPGEDPPPTAALSVSPSSGPAPVQVVADASGSSDPQGQALTYTFDFGDGTQQGPQAQPSASHTYTSPGTYTVRVEVTDTAAQTSTAQQSVVVTDPPPPGEDPPPTAALSVSPSSGPAPVQVVADASGSSDPQGQALTYTFDFGDGTQQGPQAQPSASHTYTSPGTYTVRVEVTDTAAQTSTAQQSVVVTDPAPAPAPSYVNSVATNYSTSTKTSGYITVWRSAGVQAGNLVVLSLQLAGTANTGAVTGTDDAGNTYTVASSVSDGSGNRLVLLSGVVANPLPVGARITVTFPSATGYRLGGDEIAGATAVDQVAAASGTTATFSSGPTGMTSTPGELVFGAVSVTAGTTSPTWDPGWTVVGSHAVGTRYLARAQRVTTTTGSFTASGTASGPWLASVVTFRP